MSWTWGSCSVVSVAEIAAANPEQRGRTVIKEAVLQRIAAQAATEVHGVADSGSGLDKVIGRRLPKADARVAGTRARVAVGIAVAWPHPLATVAAGVREHVTERLRDLTGLSIDAVDVDVARVVRATESRPRRVQ